MKPLMLMSTATLVAALTVSDNAMAGRADHEGAHARVDRIERSVDRRLAKQDRRIGQGLRSGDLTRGEIKHLRKQQRRVARMDRHFAADGHYTPRERGLIRKALDKSSHNIYKTKHNHRDRARHHSHAPKYRKGYKYGYGHGHLTGHGHGHHSFYFAGRSEPESRKTLCPNPVSGTIWLRRSAENSGSR